MGYTEQHTDILLGLGVSSISDCGTAFAQNAKTVEEYKQQINNGFLAVLKGHLLDEEDMETRQHILNLMCKNSTCFKELLPTAALDHLKPMVEDGLVSVRDRSVTIQPLGRSFLRNVCMAFDKRLWQKQPQSQLFSAAI
jgi:oxygen-independent coproporphyrinogen-3 oxidase